MVQGKLLNWVIVQILIYIFIKNQNMTQSNRNHNYHLTLSSDGDLNFENQIHFEAENHHQND